MMEWKVNDILVCKNYYSNIKVGDIMVIQSVLRYEENIIIINGYWFYKNPNSMGIANLWVDECFTNISRLKRLRKDKLNEINRA